MIAKLLLARRNKVLVLTGVALVLSTGLDWATGQHVSMAPLYIIPMMLGAVVLRKAECVALAVICAFLRAWFDVPGPPADLVLRFIFATIAYFLSALFVSALIHKHQLALDHVAQLGIEQNKRQDVEEQLRLLVESSPAAIFVSDETGCILTANEAANQLLAVRDGDCLVNQNICSYLPFFSGAIGMNPRELGLRTAVKCQGQRANGEPFSADVWFSSYQSTEGKRLSAIVADSSEEMRDREEQSLLNVKTGNRIATAAIAHEVRNFCQAIGMLTDDLRRRHQLGNDDTLRGVDGLVGGLERIASFELRSPNEEQIGPIDLKDVLDNLRIVIEAEWRETGGEVHWRIPALVPPVFADPHGLLQAFLNLAQNSYRAVQTSKVRFLKIVVGSDQDKVTIRFQDSGPGVQQPEALFQPFHKASAGSGLGLYVSRFIVRGYGGELRYDADCSETCFTVELDALSIRDLTDWR